MLDVLSFLLSKIPPDFDGETSWWTHSLQAFINEYPQHTKSKEENNDFGLEGWVFKDLNVDEKPSVGYKSRHLGKENQTASASLDTIEENLRMSISDESLSGSQVFTNNEITSMQKESDVQVSLNPEITSDLEPKKSFKRKSKCKIKTEENLMLSISDANLYGLDGWLNSENTSDLERKKASKRKSKCKIKTEEKSDGLLNIQDHDTGKSNQKDVKIQEEKLKLEGAVKSFKFHCVLCYCNFENEEDLRNHDLENHCNNETYKCDNCDYTAAKKNELIEHYADQHKESKIFLIRKNSSGQNGQYSYRKLKYCRHCDQIFGVAWHLRKHLYQSHNQSVPKNQCLMCDREFEKVKGVDHHMYNHHIGLKIKCSTKSFRCDEIFDTDEEFQIHFTEKHQRADEYTCHICGQIFSSLNRAKFNRHVDSHEMEGKQKPAFECKQCLKVFFFETDLKRHLSSTTHGGKTFPCSICDYKASKKQNLKVHMDENHSSERPFGCDICGKRFSYIGYFQNHQTVHDIIRKYECSVCSKKFKNRKHLNVHVKIHRQQYSAQCEYCDVKFIQMQNMKPHMKKHHPEMVKIEEKDK